MANVNHEILTRHFYLHGSSITRCRSVTHPGETFIVIHNSDGTRLSLWINHRARNSDILRLRPDYVAPAPAPAPAPAHYHYHYMPYRELFPIRSQWRLEWPDNQDMPHLVETNIGIFRDLASIDGRIISLPRFED